MVFQLKLFNYLKISIAFRYWWHWWGKSYLSMIISLSLVQGISSDHLLDIESLWKRGLLYQKVSFFYIKMILASPRFRKWLREVYPCEIIRLTVRRLILFFTFLSIELCNLTVSVIILMELVDETRLLVLLCW